MSLNDLTWINNQTKYIADSFNLWKCIYCKWFCETAKSRISSAVNMWDLMNIKKRENNLRSVKFWRTLNSWQPMKKRRVLDLLYDLSCEVKAARPLFELIWKHVYLWPSFILFSTIPWLRVPLWKIVNNMQNLSTLSFSVPKYI